MLDTPLMLVELSGRLTRLSGRVIWTMIRPGRVCVVPAPKPPEFRRRALDLVAQGEPVAQVAKNLGISESCLRRWMDRDDIDAGRKEGLTSAEHKELVELRRRNRVLEMENEILKRASAYFARENILPK